MHRRAERLLTLALLAAFASGCGDSIVAVGDWPGTLRIVAGVPDSVGPTSDEIATRAHLYTPRGLVAAADGTLYIAETGGGRVLAVEPDGSLGVVLDDAQCESISCLRTPYGIALDDGGAQDDGGALLITDTARHMLVRYDLRTRAVTVVAGTGRRESSANGTVATDASLLVPTAVALGDGQIFIAETGANRVRVITADGILNTIAGTGTSGSAGDGGPAISAQLTRPEGLAYFDNTLYIADKGNHRVRAVDLGTGLIRTIAGNGLALFNGDGGLAVSASLNTPTALAISRNGEKLFIADTDNHRVRVVELRTGLIRTIAGTGETGFDAGGSAGATALREPAGLAVSPFDLLYIADTGHHIVWRGAIEFD